jgi:hypothetical protein
MRMALEHNIINACELIVHFFLLEKINQEIFVFLPFFFLDTTADRRIIDQFGSLPGEL